MARTQRRSAISMPEWPEAGAGRRIVFLVDASSRLERRLIERWITEQAPTEPGAGGPGAPARLPEAIPIPSSRRRPRRPGRRRPDLDPRLEAALATADDPLLAPLRVIWRAPLRDGERRASLLGLLTAGDPRDPNLLRQAWVLLRDPDRCAIVAGEPALASDLRARWTEACGVDHAETLGFAEFVVQKATLALERAERRVRGARYKVPRLVHEEILGRPAFRGGLARILEERRLAGDTKSTLAGLTAEAERDLKEIAATHSPLVIDLVIQLIRFMMRGYRDSPVYDRTAMKEIAALEEQHPVVFLPTHKSNLDHLSLQYALHEHGLPPNHTAGGINMNFLPVGPLVRRSGVFFIRRSFRDDAVYKHVLAHYVDYLIEKRFPLEWYIEGGRSRSGKLLPPRFGLLANVVDSYRRGKSEDVILVPVSIAYDQIHDVGSYAREQRGGTKERESLGWFVRMLRQLNRSYGRIHIDFGEPLSLREQLGPPGADAGADRRFALEKLAFEVSVRINRVTPITPTSLVTLALLGTTGQALSLAETRQSLANLLANVRERGLPTTADFHLLERDEGIAATLEALVENGVLTRFDEGIEPVYGIGDDQQLSAAYYRNTVIHFFVPNAIAELALLKAAEGDRGRTLETFWAEVGRLRDLLKFEFFFPEKDAFREEVRAALERTVRSWEQRIAEYEVDPVELVRRARPFCSHRVLRPFLDSYRVAADKLATLDPAQPFDEKRFLTGCLGLGRQYALQKRIHAADSVSKVLFQTALRLADNRGLLGVGGEELGRARREFAAELRDAVRRVDIVVALAAERRAGFLS